MKKLYICSQEGKCDSAVCPCKKPHKASDNCFGYCAFKKKRVKCIPYKPKPRMVRVKGWAVLLNKQVNKQKNTWKKEIDSASPIKHPLFKNVPCIILVEEKYMRGENNG